MPWMTRATIIGPMLPARAAIREPTASAPSATTSIRSLPTLSAIRPMIGVNTEAESR